jgi:hypothetical protein
MIIRFKLNDLETLSRRGRYPLTASDGLIRLGRFKPAKERKK